MSFATEKIKAGSFKICLAELDLPVTTEAFTSYSAGIWQVCLSPDLGTDGITITDDHGIVGYFEETFTTALMRVGSVTVDDEVYSSQSSMAGMVAQNNSFYYRLSDYMLFIHFDGFTIPWGYTVRLGLILGFCDKPGLENGAYYDDIYYDPRITSIPALKKQKDVLFNGILQYTGGSVTFINSDGYFEDLTQDWNIFGQPVRILFGFDGLDFSDFRQVFEGIVNDYSYDRDKFQLSIIDPRKFFSRKIPTRQFDATTYPNMEPDNVGKVKPLAWGDIRNAPLVCVNELSAIPSTYTFYIADTTENPVNSVSAVRIDGVTLSTTKWTATSGFLYISTSASTSDNSGDTIYVSDNLGAITADFNAYSTNTLGLDVIQDILLNYAGLSTAVAVDNYDSTEWTLERALSRNVGIYLNEETEISDVIKDVCVAEDGIFLVMDDGRYTFRHESTTRTVDRTIRTDEWIDDPKVDYKRNEYLTSVKIKYDKNQEDDEYYSYTNTTYESDSFSRYKTYAQKEFETVISSSDAAAAKSETVMTISKDIVPTVTRKTKTQNIDLEIMDVIEAEHGRQSVAAKPWAEYEIIGIQKDMNKAEVQLSMRWRQDIDAPTDLAAIAYRVAES